LSEAVYGPTATFRGRIERDLAFTAALFVLALGVRLFVAIAWSKEPVWDGHYYHFGAERIAAGLGYSEDVLVRGVPVWKPWTHYPVGYSALLGAVYFVFGSGPLVGPVFNAFVGAVVVALVHRLALTCLVRTRARVAGAVAALHPGLIAYAALIMTELCAAAFLLGALLVAVHYRAHFKGALFAGALLGLGALVRPVSLLALPLLFLVWSGGFKVALGRTALAVVAALLVISPWTLRNCQRMDGCALISTNGGWNLAIGAITETGRFQTLRASDGCPIVTGQVQQDRCWAKVGLDRISKDPLGWLARAPKKLEQTYNHESFAIEYLREADPSTWNEARREAGRELLTFFHRLLLVVSALGTVSLITRFEPRPSDAITQLCLFVGIALFTAFAAAKDTHPFWVLPAAAPLFSLLPLPGAPRRTRVEYVLLGLLLATSFTHVLFFGEDRYHLVMTPVLCILAASALRTPEESLAVAESARLSPNSSPVSSQRPF
jgi:4-amino-4-deoxy-L-arabinose transferase-like glycosyltransferase